VGKFSDPQVCESNPQKDSGALFGTIQNSMFTLFSVITVNGWGDLASCSMQVQPWTWVIFVLFLLCTSYGMMNVIVAVIVEGTLERAMAQHREQAQQEEAKRRAIITQVFEIFYKADVNQDGLVTKPEFLRALEQKDVMRKLLLIGIDVRKAKNLFDILDYDNSGSLDLQEFIHGMMRARGEAQAKDVLALQCDVMRAEQQFREELQHCRDCFIQRMDPIDEDIEAAHAEVRRLIFLLKANGAESRDSEDCDGGLLGTPRDSARTT